MRLSFCYAVLCIVLVLGMSFSPTNAQSPQSPEGFDLQGHRGARGLAPENTIPAFRTALEIGVTTLEMDVVISKDGVVVVSHEPWMGEEKCRTPEGGRIEDGKGRHRIFEMTYEQIADYDCGSLTLASFPEQKGTAAPKPRLRDVIQMAEAYVAEHDRPPIFYNIETKSRSEWDGTFHPKPTVFAERVLAVVDDEGVAPRTTIQSFDPRTLEVVHEQNASVRTALLVGWSESDGLEEDLATLSFVPDIYSPNARLVDEALVAAAHDRGVQLIPWTVNEPAAMKRLLRLGVDGLITDYPDRGRDVLRQRRGDS
ncbi:glycerophosphodiester phosphodiesterase [Salinibacter sp. 10B]|uniref:glycerophosphodiester phosphodiesterase family protein n=1 Tax=Salinibacter sp. 10B TaxID=1923971 RepID=UPI000CF4BF55|nr:glycerophosphodiester phosphodiesterase family protein [Salinibacter sp. 10B]PQJ33997.1 glycerophosphodiester phosphodiesterase [Salinibacter sp. 10B]